MASEEQGSVDTWENELCSDVWTYVVGAVEVGSVQPWGARWRAKYGSEVLGLYHDQAEAMKWVVLRHRVKCAEGAA